MINKQNLEVVGNANHGRPGFYSHYLKLFNDDNQEDQFTTRNERDLLLQNSGKTVDGILKLAPKIRHTILRPQRKLFDDPDYHVSIDQTTSTYYVCYRTLLMVDVDFYKDDSSSNNKDDIIKKIKEYALDKKLRFRLYESRNGIHAFLISREANFENPKDLQLMLDLECDFFYAVYAHLRGWAVRLNRKVKEEVMKCDLIGDVGEAPIVEHLEKLVNLHVNLIPVFKNVEGCLSFGN